MSLYHIVEQLIAAYLLSLPFPLIPPNVWDALGITIASINVSVGQ